MTYRYFNPETSMKLLRCDAGELMTLAAQLLDQCHQACDGLELALTCDEWRGVEAIARRIRSGCAMLGADAVWLRARNVEEKARRRCLQPSDLIELANALRALAIDLLRFITRQRATETTELALAA